MSSALPTTYLLVHDSVRGDNAKAKSILEAMMLKFGAPVCFYLPINSLPNPRTEKLSDWDDFLTMECSPMPSPDMVSIPGSDSPAIVHIPRAADSSPSSSHKPGHSRAASITSFTSSAESDSKVNVEVSMPALHDAMGDINGINHPLAHVESTTSTQSAGTSASEKLVVGCFLSDDDIARYGVGFVLVSRGENSPLPMLVAHWHFCYVFAFICTCGACYHSQCFVMAPTTHSLPLPTFLLK